MNDAPDNAIFDAASATIADVLHQSLPITYPDYRLPTEFPELTAFPELPAGFKTIGGYAAVYARAAGFVMTPFARGSKGPSGPGTRNWGALKKCRVPLDWDQNLGLVHVHSHTCAVDIDDEPAAAAWLATQGVSLADLLAAPDAVQITSGRPGHAKLVYRLDAPLPSRAVLNAEHHHALNFRCATKDGGSAVQDVLPPSIHPDTGAPYCWAGAGTWEKLPMLPDALRTAWEGLLCATPTRTPRLDEARGEWTDERTLAVEALEFIDPDAHGRDRWVKTGMAAQEAGCAFEDFDDWSSRGARYAGPGDAQAVWDSFSPGDITRASLFAWAAEEGWKGNTRPRLTFDELMAELMEEAARWPAPDLNPAATALDRDLALVTRETPVAEVEILVCRIVEVGGSAVAMAGRKQRLGDVTVGRRAVNRLAKDIEEARARARSAPPSGVEQWSEGALLSIGKRVAWTIMAPEAWAALPPVLAMGEALVTVQTLKPATVGEVQRDRDGEYRPKLTVTPYTLPLLRDRIMQQALFTKPGEKGPVDIAAPELLVSHLLAVGYRDAAPLIGIIEHPLVLPDGRLYAGNGYHEDTGLFLGVDPVTVPDLGGVITREQGAESLHWLRWTAFADFPFVEAIDRDAAVAASLTALMRPFLVGDEGFPGFSTNAPMASSGKTALLGTAWMLAHGHRPRVESWAGDEDETAKHLLALAMEGRGCVLWDNLPESKGFDSARVASYMTAETVGGRLLGQTKTASGVAGVMMLFTGNDIRPVGDMVTRVLQIELDADAENPSGRRFSRPDLGAWCRDNRAAILFHLCRLAAGGIRAGHAPASRTRFTSWDRLVRAPLEWAGGGDVSALLTRNLDRDPKNAGRAALLGAIFERTKGEPFQVKELLAWSPPGAAPQAWPPAKDAGPTFYADTLAELLLDLRPVRGDMDARYFGGILKKSADKPTQGYVLKKAAYDRDKVVYWKVENRNTPKTAI